MQVFGRARYDYLVQMCDEMGVVTPEHPCSGVDGPGWAGHHRPDVPALRLHVPARRATTRPKVWQSPNAIVATDEFLLSCEAYATRTPGAVTGCRPDARTRRSGPDADGFLVNHFPLRPSLRGVVLPEFSLWCGTTETAEWHTRCNAVFSLRPPASPDHLVQRVPIRGGLVGLSPGAAAPQAYRWLPDIADPQYARATSTSSAATSSSPRKCGPRPDVPERVKSRRG